MDKKVCVKCGEEKLEIAFELGRNEEPRKVCRECRSDSRKLGAKKAPYKLPLSKGVYWQEWIRNNGREF